MDQSTDPNVAIWQSDEVVHTWVAEAKRHERNRAAQRRFMAVLLPFGEQEAFTFLDLGAGTGAASRAILDLHPRSTAILADFSSQMMAAGESEMESFAGRYRYVEFNMTTGEWPAAIPAALDAVVTSMSVHHLTDERKQGLFAEIFARLVPGGWYLNYDPVRTDDPLVEAAWPGAGTGARGGRRSRGRRWVGEAGPGAMAARALQTAAMSVRGSPSTTMRSAS